MGQSRFLVNNDSPLWELLCWKAAPSAGQRHQGEHLLCYLRSTDSGVQTGAPLLLADGPWVICLSEPQCPHPSKWQRFFLGGGGVAVWHVIIFTSVGAMSGIEQVLNGWYFLAVIFVSLNDQDRLWLVFVGGECDWPCRGDSATAGTQISLITYFRWYSLTRGLSNAQSPGFGFQKITQDESVFLFPVRQKYMSRQRTLTVWGWN